MNTKKTIFIYIVAFLILNFAALALGSLATSVAVNGEWYVNINKAPWTPPGWFFGVAWTSIMLCFAVFMAYAWRDVNNKKKLATVYAVQWFLNVSWTPVFFVYQQVIPGLIVITTLTAVVGYFLIAYRYVLKAKAVLVVPYFLWLLVATSLNLYILMYN